MSAGTTAQTSLAVLSAKCSRMISRWRSATLSGVLLTIERLGPVSQKQISDQVGLDPSDLVGVIDILEREGFLTRARDPQDRRRYSLTLTALGRKRLRRFSTIAAEVEEELLAPLDDDERQTFRLLVHRVLEHQRQPDAPPRAG